MSSSDSDSDSGWNKELLTAVSKKQGKTKTIFEEDRIEQIENRLEQGADINYQDKKNGTTALHLAVKRGYKMIVQFLLRTGARTDIPDRKGRTAVTLAENHEDKDIARIFNRPSTSSSSPLGRLNRKRTADAENDDHDVSPCKTRLIDALQQPDLQRDGAKEETFKASGLKNTLHRMVYQLKHLMLILHRARNMGSSFRLATEMDAAEEFYDVVLRYRDKNGDEVYRFVKLKHKKDETKAISASDLSNVKIKDFSLLNYFIAWRKINKNSDFDGSGSKKFILCTNIGLDVDDLKKANINFEKVTEPDDFLKVWTRSRQPPRYKLLVENPSDLWDTLKSASDCHRLAKELAERVHGAQEIQLRSDIIKSYHVALAEKVVDVGARKFNVNFIQNNRLSGEAAAFREILFLNTKRLMSKRNQTEKYVWKFLEESELKLSLTFMGKKPLPTTIPEQILFTELPVDQIDDAEISRFLDELTVAVNQPNEVELDEMIKHEIGDQFDLPDAEFVSDSFMRQILDWFKTKQGKFLQKKDADDFFDELKDELDSLKTTALRFEYPEKLEKLGIRFKRENTELENFINRSNHASNHQVLEIICPKQTLLAALQVRQTLSERPKSTENEEFIFIRHETLSTPEVIDLVLGAFKWSDNHNLLVVDCGSCSANQHLQTLWNPLCDIMAKNVQKRMIVITQTGEGLGPEFRLDRQRYYVNDLEHGFCNLKKHSQKKLLHQRAVKFQGQNRKTSFKELLGIHDSENLTKDELKDLLKIMNSDILFKLISGDIPILYKSYNLSSRCHQRRPSQGKAKA